MNVVRPDQIIIVVLFLTLLGLAWFVVRMKGAGLGAKVRQGRRISVAEVTALSPTDRAMIINVDGTDFLVLKSKGSPASLTRLDAKEAAE